MKNKKYMFILSILFIVLIIIVAVQGYLLWNLTQEKNGNNKENSNNGNISYTATEDAKRFKEEYEALNGTVRESDGETYNTVSIPEENPIVYITLEQYLDVINSEEESYIYMSSPDCPYCRATVGTLLEVLKDLGVEKLYYYDLGSSMTFENEEQKDEIVNTLIEKGFVTRKEDGTESWRIPLIAKTKGGEVLAKNIGTGISYNEGQSKYSELTEEQKQEVYNQYYELLKDCCGNDN